MKNTQQEKVKKMPRYIIIIIAVIVFSAAGIFYILISKNKFQGFDGKYSFLSPAVEFIKSDDLLVNFQPLRESLQRKYEKRDDFLISLYFEYLPTGANVSINKDEKIWPASLIKIPVAMAAMKKVQNGSWKLTNELVILDEDKDSEFGNLHLKPTGTTMTIQEFLRESLVNSDNTAHFVILRNLENNELENVYEHLGFDDVLETLKKAPRSEEIDNRITAKRYTIFFRSLYNATYLNPDYSQLFLDILKDAPKEYLSSGLPENIIFTHKTGVRADEQVWADAGIVYVPGRPYLLTVMIQEKDAAKAELSEISALFKEISKEIYDYVAKH